MSATETAHQILQDRSVGVMATNHNGMPNSRYMTFMYVGSKLYTVAKTDSSVVQEIADNPATHILLGYEGEGVLDTFLEIEGHAIVATNDVVKQKLLEKYPAATAEELVVIQVTPTRARVMNKSGEQQEEAHI